MSGIVLCDGSPSALKAVEFGGYPGMLLEKHEGTQLIVAHVWSKETNTVVRSASPNSRSPSSAGLPPTSMDGVRLAVSRATRDGFSGNDYPVYYVLHTVASTIQESKLLHTLNYKVETYVLPPITPKTDELDNNNGGGGAGKSGSLSARGISASSKASMAAKANSGRRGVEEPVREERIMAPEEIQKRRAEEIVAYGRQRAEHHHATALLLGPGNLLEGKTIVLGSVARAALRMLKTDFALYFIKEDGFTVRPTTAVMRCVVVVVVGNGGRAAAAEEKGILGPAPAELTQVTEEGKSAAAIDETEAVVDALAATAATVKGSFDAGAIHTASSSTPHPPLCSDGYWANRAAEEEAVAEGLLGADALAAGQAAVRYALSRRHANARLCVSVVLVADCTTTEEEVQRYEAAFESQLESAAAAARAPTATTVVAEEEGDDDEGGASPPTEAVEAAPVAVDAEVPHDTPPVPDAAASARNNSISGSGNESATNPLPPQSLSPQPVEDLWPSVSVCRLKPTKHIAEPNVVNSTIQITKFLQQHKTEFVVLADSAPFVVQQAFLTTMKPHCVVVPHLRY